MIMEYKGYVGVVEFDDSVDLFHGRVVNTRDIITFEGTTAQELKDALAGSVEDYLAWCAERGKKPEKPFSGRLLLRVRPEMHRALFEAAARSNTSLNKFIAQALEERVHAMA